MRTVIKLSAYFISGFIGGFGVAEFCKTWNLIFLLCLIPSIGCLYLMIRKK